MVESAKKFEVGQEVKVVRGDEEWLGWRPEMDRTVGRTGKVIHVIDSGNYTKVHVSFGDCMWFYRPCNLEPVVETPAPRFKVGDNVKVVKKDGDYRYWMDSMDKTVGRVGQVVEYYEETEGEIEFCVQIDGVNWKYRLSALELLPNPGEGWRLIDPKVDTPESGDEVWYGSTSEWRPRFVSDSTSFQEKYAYRRRVVAPGPAPVCYRFLAPHETLKEGDRLNSKANEESRDPNSDSGWITVNPCDFGKPVSFFHLMRARRPIVTYRGSIEAGEGYRLLDAEEEKSIGDDCDLKDRKEIDWVTVSEDGDQARGLVYRRLLATDPQISVVTTPDGSQDYMQTRPVVTATIEQILDGQEAAALGKVITDSSPGWEHEVFHWSDTRKKIYIAGPMRGIRHFNFPAFDAARDLLTETGWNPISPADLDRATGFDEKAFPDDYDWIDLKKIGFSVHDAIDRDVEAIKSCDAIYMLKGWENSKGAKAEKAMAEWLGLEIKYEQPYVTDRPPTTTGKCEMVMDSEGFIRSFGFDPVTDGQTVTNERGGKQSHVSARFDCIPPETLRLLAQCLGFGAKKYGKDNWRQIDFEDNLCHAMNHINEWRMGDRSEPHLVNAMARITFALSQAVASGEQDKTYVHPDTVGAKAGCCHE